MASKYSVELDLNTKGYSDGIQNAEDANADFVSSLGAAGKALPNLRKELAATKKETMGLALAYHKLSAEEKKSGYGQQMARALEEAKQKTADLIDLNEDLTKELKNRASDTAAWDAMKEGIGIARDAATGFIGTIATLTGKEKELQPLIAKIAQVQGIANAAIGIGNALQKQSAIMLGISKVQKLALAKATELEAAATGKATIAQKAFNLVAKANPYVLLASVAIAAGAAIASYIIFKDKETEAEKKAREEREKAIESMKEYKDEINKVGANVQGQLYGSFVKLQAQWKSLKTTAEKTQWIKDNQTAFKELGVSVNNVSDAERVFIQDTQKMVQAIMLRARAAQLQKQIEDQLSEGIKTTDDNGIETYTLGYASAQHSAEELVSVQQELNKLLGDANKLSGGKSSGSSNQEIKALPGSIAAITQKISDLQEQAKKGLLPPELNSPSKFAAKMKSLNDSLKELQIKWGFAEPDSKLKELQKKLEDAEKAYIIAVDSNDEQARQAAKELYYKIQDELDKYKASIKIEARTSDADRAKIQKEVDDIVNEALNGKQEAPSFDFSALKEKLPESLRPAIDTTLEEYNRVYEARQQLMDKMNEEGASDAAIAKAQDGLDALHDKWTQLCEDVETYNEANEAIKKANANTQELANTVSGVGNAVQAAGTLFSALGDASEDNSMKAMGIIAQAVATVALSFAKALTTCKTWIDWLAFGISGMATMVTMVSQIKNLNAGSYSNGGIVGGHSYYGDKLFARVNSREGIFNEKQMKSLNEQLDSKKIAAIGMPMSVHVEGVIRGKDLLLVQRNCNMIASRSGQNINF